MKKFLFFLITIGAVGLLPLAGRTLVLPFRMETGGQTSSQWIGKAVSYYLISGLEENEIDTVSEDELQGLLNRNYLRFPYDFTKAYAIRIARQCSAKTLVWGEIRTSSPRGKLQVTMECIDCEQFTFPELPPVSFRINDIYIMQGELLTMLVKTLDSKKDKVALPLLTMPLTDYEKVIKSLLVADPGKRNEILGSVSEQSRNSDLVNFLLGKNSIQKKSWEEAQKHLGRINDNLLFRNEKAFLLSYCDFHLNREDESLNGLIRLQRDNIYAVETNNNLGILYLRRKDYETAEKCFRYALYLKKDSRIYLNYIHLLQQAGKKEQAHALTVAGLGDFPDNETLMRVFVRNMLADPNREALYEVFKNYIPDVVLKEENFVLTPQMMTPFDGFGGPAADESRMFHQDAMTLYREANYDGALEKVENALDINPFQASCHHLLSLVMMRKKQFLRAEMYACSALFLVDSAENNLLLAQVYDAIGDRERAGRVRREARKKFPDNKELQTL